MNMTPERSEGIICWTITASEGSSPILWLARYEITRSPYSDAQQSTTRARSSSSPETLVKVAFMPANDVPELSSLVPDERTATAGRSRAGDRRHGWPERDGRERASHRNEVLRLVGAGAQARRSRRESALLDHLSQLRARPAPVDGVEEGAARDHESRGDGQAGGGQLAEVGPLAAHLGASSRRMLVEPTNRFHVISPRCRAASGHDVPVGGHCRGHRRSRRGFLGHCHRRLHARVSGPPSVPLGSRSGPGAVRTPCSTLRV